MDMDSAFSLRKQTSWLGGPHLIYKQCGETPQSTCAVIVVTSCDMWSSAGPKLQSPIRLIVSTLIIQYYEPHKSDVTMAAITNTLIKSWCYSKL